MTQVRLTADFKVNLLRLRELHFNSRLKCRSRVALVLSYVIALGQIVCLSHKLSGTSIRGLVFNLVILNIDIRI